MVKKHKLIIISASIIVFSATVWFAYYCYHGNNNHEYVYGTPCDDGDWYTSPIEPAYKLLIAAQSNNTVLACQVIIKPKNENSISDTFLQINNVLTDTDILPETAIYRVGTIEDSNAFNVIVYNRKNPNRKISVGIVGNSTDINTKYRADLIVENETNNKNIDSYKILRPFVDYSIK